MALSAQGRSLDRKKFFRDPFLIVSILFLLGFLTLFIIYPLTILLKDGFASSTKAFTFDSFAYAFTKTSGFMTAMKNSIIIGLAVSFGATIVALLFAYVEVYVKTKIRLVNSFLKLSF